jgi:uncharacterized protein (DUF934 family)
MGRPCARWVSDPLLDTIEEMLRCGIDKSVLRSDCETQDLFISLNGIGYFLLSQIRATPVRGRRPRTNAADAGE